MNKFRANWQKIEEFEIIKETEKQVVYICNGRELREAKISDWASWHNTKEDARNYLIAKKEFEIEKLMSQIEYKQEEIEKIKKF